MANDVTHLDPLNNKNTIKYQGKDNKTTSINFTNLQQALHSNKIFNRGEIDWYNKFSRYGYLDPYNTDQISREFLFFTKPDLNIFTNTDGSDITVNSYNNCILNPALQNIPFFTDAVKYRKDALAQLQYSIKDKNGVQNPFMYLLSNSVTSKLDLPGISADSRESTTNIMGINIQYRGHSLKSDNGYDFSLSFTDTHYLEVYTLLKAYDEYIRLLKLGEVSPKRDYIINKILSDQFSIYKFLIGSDGETILYYAKLTGCYFTDVPRSDMGDPGNDGFKFSPSFHAQFVEDSNPLILNDFNRISPAFSKAWVKNEDTGKYVLNSNQKFADTYDYENVAVNNEWVSWPIVISDTSKPNIGLNTRFNNNYKMKWIK